MCKNTFTATSQNINIRFCSRKCYWASMVGRKIKKSTLAKVRKTNIKNKMWGIFINKNCLVCSKSIKVTPCHKKRSFCSKKCFAVYRKNKKRPEISSENHYLWKGDKAKLTAIHGWIKRRIVKTKCLFCGVQDRLQYANKSGKYTRNLNDWLILCPKCHSRFDKKWLNLERDKYGRFCGSKNGYVSAYKLPR